MSRSPGFDWVDASLEDIRGAGLERHLLELDGPPGPTAHLGGRRHILLGSNNYLDLAGHPTVVEGAVAAARRHGAGAGASRLVSGASALQRTLEERLAAFLGVEAALLFSSGYLANTGTIPALVGAGDEVFSDSLNHASIIDGCRLSGATVTVYPHRDAGFLAEALAASRARRRLIVSDAVFSMEGDACPVEELQGLAATHGAMLLLDESHSFGVVGAGGRGLVAAVAGGGGGALVMATLSKALGAAGGFVAGPAPVIEYLRQRARTFIFDTAPAPAAVGAALAALGVLEAEPARAERVRALAGRLAEGLRAAGLGVPVPAAAIVPLVVGEAEAAIALAAAARERGVIVFPIRPPSVPPGTSRLRLTVTAGFSEAMVDTAIDALAAAAAAVG